VKHPNITAALLVEEAELFAVLHGLGVDGVQLLEGMLREQQDG
jgi:hypothetical protein